MDKGSMEQFRGELEAELKGNILPFWIKHVPDHLHGGFHGHVSHSNEAIEKAPKGAIMNARILWTFSAAYRMYPESSYLETAERAYHYILDHIIDKEYGGVYWELDYKGEVSSSRKQIYALAFTIYAMAEYHMACGDKEALETAISLFQQIEEHALDKENGGYTEALSREWKPVEDLRLSEKDDNESKTMNTHLHILEAYANLYRTWKDPLLGKALEEIILLFLEKFVDPQSYHLKLFFDDNWTLKSNLISYGHDIECAWLLHEAAEILGLPELVKRTGKMAVQMARANIQGLDEDGGLYYEFFPSELRLDTDKHWWPQAEAMVGYFNAYQLSAEQEFASKARGSWEFIKKYLVDSKYGEWYWSVDRTGKPQTENEKAGFWKCPYHNGRACLELIRRIDQINS
jgi:mannobiose 2-epimerase